MGVLSNVVVEEKGDQGQFLVSFCGQMIHATFQGIHVYNIIFQPLLPWYDPEKDTDFVHWMNCSIDAKFVQKLKEYSTRKGNF